MTHSILLFILAVLLVWACPAQQRGVEITSSARERRIALVIGNSAYTNVPSLRNPANDARDMAAALSEVGFKVTSGIDITRREMRHLIREFGQSLKSGGSGLFYYAGHGVQSKGHNYLIPVDAEIETEAEIEDAGVDLNLVLNSMDEAENGLNIVILDACRNNPFARGFRSTSGGLAQVDAPTGTLIAYATAPGKVARDGDGRNGVYTEELLKQIRVPGLTIEDLLKRVRTNLKQRTKGEQVPWESSSLVGNFYFALPNNAVSNSKPDIPNSEPTAETGPRQFLLTAVDANLPVQKLETRTKILERRTESNALTTGTLRYNVTNYRIEAQLMISQQFLLAAADITFVPIEASRAFFFELNGSLDVESVERNGKLLTGTTQDRVGGGPLGPNIRVDLNEVVPASEPITLRFRWHGPLVSAVGGPLALKRLAYIGAEGSYLMYASRWFPFHDYSADTATADLTIIVPSDIQVAGSSDEPIQQESLGNTTRYRLTSSKPVLVGNLVAGKYMVRDLNSGSYHVSFYCRPSGSKFVDRFGALIGQALQFYTREFGPPSFGTSLIVAQIDDASMETYSGSGILFISEKSFQGEISEERLLTELALQWWGHTVGLKSFNDVWLSQGLAQWSSYAFREASADSSTVAQMRNTLEARARKFTDTSIERAPWILDDQSEAYRSIIFDKGAVAFLNLRDELGTEKFHSLLRMFLRQYRGRNASINDFEALTNEVAGRSMRPFFLKWINTPSGIRLGRE